jgi:hypothetical protein
MIDELAAKGYIMLDRAPWTYDLLPPQFMWQASSKRYLWAVGESFTGTIDLRRGQG